jgi:hypothetical protein
MHVQHLRIYFWRVQHNCPAMHHQHARCAVFISKLSQHHPLVTLHKIDCCTCTKRCTLSSWESSGATAWPASTVSAARTALSASRSKCGSDAGANTCNMRHHTKTHRFSHCAMRAVGASPWPGEHMSAHARASVRWPPRVQCTRLCASCTVGCAGHRILLPAATGAKHA